MYTVYEARVFYLTMMWVVIIWDERGIEPPTRRLVTTGNLPTVNHYGHDKARDHHHSKDLSLIHLEVL